MAHRHPPPQGSLLRGQLPPFLNGFFQSSGQVLVRVMGTVSDVLHRLGASPLVANAVLLIKTAKTSISDITFIIRFFIGTPLSVVFNNIIHLFEICFNKEYKNDVFKNIHIQ